MRFEHKIKREEQVKAGAYDGRFRAKVVPNKKKKEAKEWARGSFNFKTNR